MLKLRSNGACLFAALWLIACVALPAHAAEQPELMPAVFPERLNFPEAPITATPVMLVAPVAPPQRSMVALPTPQFTGLTAMVVLGVLLSCRKSLLRMIC